jgi:hypothetical protein
MIQVRVEALSLPSAEPKKRDCWSEERKEEIDLLSTLADMTTSAALFESQVFLFSTMLANAAVLATATIAVGFASRSHRKKERAREQER